MRERPAVIVVTLLAVLLLIMACVPFLPTLLLLLSGRESEKSQRAARAQIAQQITTYANEVVSRSTSPAGPSPTELADLGNRASLDYAEDRSGGALTALTVMANALAGGSFGPYTVHECYTIGFRALGTPGASFQITHLADCTAVLPRLNARTPTPHPSANSTR